MMVYIHIRTAQLKGSHKYTREQLVYVREESSSCHNKAVLENR